MYISTRLNLGRKLVLVSLLLFSCNTVAGESTPAVPSANEECASSEECFRLALSPFPALATASERVTRKIERLRRIREQYPASLWARRAGLLTGVLLLDRQPAEALPFLRSAQRDFPILEDYIRLWIGEALLKSGDASAAAAWLERTPELVPDTLLGPRLAYRTGEAWFRAGECRSAVEPLARGVVQEPQDSDASRALLMLADCQALDNQSTESIATLRQLWTRYPQTSEANEAEKKLSLRPNGETWKPTPDERYTRAVAWLAAALNDEAVEELKTFLSSAPGHPKRDEAKLKLGTALVRLKRYEQAKSVFHELASAGASHEANEAAVWLARVYLRLGDGERLLNLRRTFSKLTLMPEQQASILIMTGTWLDDQNQFDQAIINYRQIVQFGNHTEQRAEALWRIGWLHYRAGRYPDAVQTLQELVTIKEDPANNPQALYWTARSLERLQDSKAAEIYLTLCRKYVWTYYCQLTRSRKEMPPPTIENGSAAIETDTEIHWTITRDVHYRRAVELRTLGLESAAGREVASLTDHYARNRAALIEVTARLSEGGAYAQGLRLARLYFRDGLERGLEPVHPSLWSVAYPTVYLPIIRAHVGSRLDPYLAAAVIREESQYDVRAVSRMGAIGLMQLMPATAQAVAQRNGHAVVRDELFDQETNIRYGVRYLEQLADQFNGNLVYTIAAYNAGPIAVSGWIQKFGDKDPDEFVEMIPYQETRQYVRRVLRSYREYRRLDGGDCTVRPLDKTC